MSKIRGFRERVYHIVDNEEEQNFASQTFEIFITLLILTSIITIVVESFAHLREVYGVYFDVFENLTLGIFTVEYLLRVWTADFKYKESKSWAGAAWKFVRSSTGVVDLVAISPIFFFLGGMFGIGGGMRGGDFRFIRILKITRLLRIFKMNSFTNSITVVAEVFTEKRHDLGITLFVTFVLLLVSSTIMWYVEGAEQPDLFPNIVASFWWAIATLTTVGYGDVFPITPLGKFLSGFIALLGIGLVALPAGILSSAFIEKLEGGIGSSSEGGDEPKKMLPQAQFQAVIGSKKSEETTTRTAQKVVVVDHENCQQHFGKAFVYCPYCGNKLEDSGEHEHGA